MSWLVADDADEPPPTRTVQVADTCLGGADPGTPVQLAASYKVLADHVPGKRTKPKDPPPEPREGLVEAVDQANDATVTGLGLDLGRWVRVEDSQVHGDPQDTAPPATVPAATLPDTVGQAAADGWSLTYTGCWASGLTVAELHRDLTGGYTAALRLETTPEATDPTLTTLTASALVSTPTEGGPGPGDLDEVAAPCWAQAPADPDAPPAFAWAGTPWFGPAAGGFALP